MTQPKPDAQPAAQAKPPSPNADLERAKLQAELRSVQVKARMDELDLAMKMVPDLSKLRESTFSVGKAETPPALATSVLAMALDHAAEELAGQLSEAFTAHARVLVTGEVDLIQGDAVYWDVTSGLKRLTAAATHLLDQTDPGRLKLPAPKGVTTIFAAAAAVLPSVLSLISAQRTVASAPVTVDELATAVAVMKALQDKAKPDRAITVVHEPFRLLPDSEVHRSEKELSELSDQLRARRVQLEAAGGQSEGDVPEPIAMIDGLVAAIEDYLTTIRAVPAGGRSPLSVAALHDLLHGSGPETFTHVLLVKAMPSQAVQFTSNGWLWRKDRFTTMVDVAISFELLGVRQSALLRCGTVHASAAASGKVGDELPTTYAAHRLTPAPAPAAD